MPLTLLLHGRHTDSPVHYHPFGAWLLPWRLSAFEEEYQALRGGVGLLDYSREALIEVRGADRVSFLQTILTNDVKRLAPGAGCRAALLDPNAKCLAELLVLAEEDAVWLSCDLERAGPVTDTLERYHFSEDVTILNHEREQAVLALQGPGTEAVADRLFGAIGALPATGDHTIVRVEGLRIRLVRYRLTDEPGLLLMVPAPAAPVLWEFLRHRGKPIGLQLVGWEALNTARIEAGIPWFGVDMGPDNLLPETGLEEILVSDTKGCFVGQEIVARIRTYGSPNKKLMGLRVEGDTVPRAGDAILSGDERAGSITSACFSPTLGRPIAMGYVKRGIYEAGTAVQIVHDATRLDATVVSRPLVPRSP